MVPTTAVGARLRASHGSWVAATVIEVLICVAIVGILLGLLLMGVQAARESARRLQCQSRVRGLLLGVSMYHDTWGSLPPGRSPCLDARYRGSSPPCSTRFHDRSVHVLILGFMDEGLHGELFDSVYSIYARENASRHKEMPRGISCPSDAISEGAMAVLPGQYEPMAPDSSDGPWLASRASYVYMFGTCPVNALPSQFLNCRVPPRVRAHLDGLFNDLSGLRLSTVHDGLSTTMAVTERAVSALDDVDHVYPGTSAEYGVWVGGDLGDTLTTTMAPPNAFRSALAGGAKWVRLYGAHSYHPGGVNVGFCDGAVRLVTETVDSWEIRPSSGQPIGSQRNPDGSWSNLPRMGIWQAISTRDGGEQLEDVP
jgi:prepilin-type processing-associated H-X9-DG protein